MKNSVMIWLIPALLALNLVSGTYSLFILARRQACVVLPLPAQKDK